MRLPLVPPRLLEAYASDPRRDVSLRVALESVRKDLVARRGSLVPLGAQPRAAAKKSIFVIGGSRRELGSAWSRSECTYSSAEVFDTFAGAWRAEAASSMRVGRILPGIAVLNGLIYVCGGEVESQILANGEVLGKYEF